MRRACNRQQDDANKVFVYAATGGEALDAVYENLANDGHEHLRESMRSNGEEYPRAEAPLYIIQAMSRCACENPSVQGAVTVVQRSRNMAPLNGS